jgi:hypothetical protein
VLTTFPDLSTTAIVCAIAAAMAEIVKGIIRMWYSVWRFVLGDAVFCERFQIPRAVQM